MTRFKQHITEAVRPARNLPTPRTKSIDRDDAIEGIKKYCGNAIKAGKKGRILYRGLQTPENQYFAYVSPSKHNRKSRNTNNLYTMVIDNSREWKKYPKRSQSIICSSSYSGARIYGEPFVVFPKDGANFGIAPSEDIWGSTRDTFDVGLADMNDDTSQVLNGILGDTSSLKGDNYKALVRALDSIDTADEEDREYSFFGWMKKYYEGDYLKMLQRILNPDANGFEQTKNPMHIPESWREVWTDSDCYLISNSWLLNNGFIVNDKLVSDFPHIKSETEEMEVYKKWLHDVEGAGR